MLSNSLAVLAEQRIKVCVDPLPGTEWESQWDPLGKKSEFLGNDHVQGIVAQEHF